MIIASVLVVCITCVVLTERFYKFRKESVVQQVPLNEVELAEIKEELAKLKSRVNGEKLERAFRG